MSVSSNKTILKNTIFLYIRMFVTMLVSLFTVRVVFRTLGVVDYGVYNVIGGFVTSIVFISNVLANASQRFFSTELGKGDLEGLKKVFNLVLFVYLLAAVSLIVLAETVGLWFINTKMDIPADRMGAANWVYQFAILAFIISLITSPFQSILVSHEKMDIYAYMSILDVILKLAIVYVLVVFSFDKLKLYAVLTCVVTFINRFIYVIICRRKFDEVKFEFTWDKHSFMSIYNYCAWILVGSFSFMLNTQGINILFNIFFGPIANASYAIGNQVKNAVNSFASSFFTATRPPIIKSYAQKEFTQTKSLFYFSSKIIYILLFILIVPLFVEIEPILQLWLDEVTDYMPNFVRLMLIYALILSMSEPITAIVQAAGEVKRYHGIVDIFTIISLPITYIIFKMGGSAYWGFGVSIIVFVIAHVLRLQVLNSFFNISLTEYVKILLLPMCISIIIVTIALFGLLCLGLNPLLIILCSFCITSVISWYIVLNKGERKAVVTIVRNKLYK